MSSLQGSGRDHNAAVALRPKRTISQGSASSFRCHGRGQPYPGNLWAPRNRPEFTGGWFVQHLGDRIECVQVCIECLLFFCGRVVSDGAKEKAIAMPIDPFEGFPFASRIDFHGPIWLMTSVLKRPLTHSAKALL